MTYREACEEARKLLSRHEVPDADLDAFLLLEYASNGLMNRARYFAFRDEEMGEELYLRYQQLVRRRAERVPLQHITGRQDFFGFPFRVNEHALIPRQDTEVLVEECMKKLLPGMKVLDLCTGSGCIIVSLKKLCPSIEASAGDLSPEALRLAAENALENGVEVFLYQGDLFDGADGSYDLIVSNPPYIPSEVIDGLMEEVRSHEPRMALDGGQDGLDFYRRIIEEAGEHLRENGWLLLEIGFDQGADVKALMEGAGFKNVEIRKDLSGKDRVILGRRIYV